MIKMEQQKNCVIYSRVSSQDQNYERQTAELKKYAADNDLKVIGIYEEKISGKNTDRPKLNEISNLVQDKKIQHILVYDLSRLARNTGAAIQFIDFLTLNNCSLTIKDLNLTTLSKTGKPDLNTTFMIQILSAVYEMERGTIRARLESGYNNHIKTGGRVGRAVGYEKPIEEMNYFNEVKRELRAKSSLRKTKDILSGRGKNISLGSIVKVKNYLISTNQI